MNQLSSLRNHENRSGTRILPPQGLSKAWRGTTVSAFFSHLNRRGGVPSGAAAFIPIVKMDNLPEYPKYPFFIENIKKPDPLWRVFSSPALCSPHNAITPGQVNRHHRAQRRGVTQGQALSPPSYFGTFPGFWTSTEPKSELLKNG